jgi:membrane-bound lytic murein transglycosylase D
MKYFFLLLSLFFIKIANAQSVYIPEKIEFAGMQLKLSESVRRSLKADVEMITKNQKYFLQKVDRANLYFPVIENIFKEEGFPDEFKYLALQESSLISDAVSSSKAVGYWQFKKESAQEVGLRVDHVVDERMNIVAASRGAAAYLRKNNFTLNNWIYALLSYNVGLGGVKPMVKEKYRGATHMDIDDNMHWYVIRFLAHKLAYENVVGKSKHSLGLVLIEDKNSGNKTLEEIARTASLDLTAVQSYNKWLLASRVPDDRSYSVILPVPSAAAPELLTVINHKAEEKKPVVEQKEEKEKPKDKTSKYNSKKILTEPPIEVINNGSDVAMLVFLNRIKAIQAQQGDDIPKLAFKAGVSIESFLAYNDLRRFDKIIPNNFYYLQPKRSKALVLKHTVLPGETLWDISQKYGIQISSIRKKNRMERKHTPEAGRVLWLRMKRPKNIPVEVIPVVKEEIKKPKDSKKEILPEVKTDPEKIKLDSIVPLLKPIKPDTSSGKISPSLPQYKIHIVNSGETMYGISRLYQVNVDSLKKWNGMFTNELKLGQELRINEKSNSVSGSYTNSTKSKTHIVKPGETIYKISREYGVSIEEIRTWNNKTDINVSIGEELIIKK